MQSGSERFDVRLLAVPAKTPDGEDFTTALARVFAIEQWMAEHFVREVPVFVKRGQEREVAERLRVTLSRLGAQVEILSAAQVGTTARHMPSLPLGTRRPTLPPGFQLSNWSEAAPMEPSRPSIIISSPAISLSSNPASSLRPTVTPTTRAVPLPASERNSFLSTAGLVLVAAAAGALAFAGITHWMRGVRDVQMLGNTAFQETASQSHYGLTGPGLTADRRTTITLIVAWSGGCLADEYAQFLQRLAETHRGELTVLAADLVLPTTGAPSAPSPESWPPHGCPSALEMLPVDRGYVSDYLEAPATYLYDADGLLVAAWSGAMSPEQRGRLTAWLDGRPLE
jgi:hypothetical protein